RESYQPHRLNQLMGPDPSLHPIRIGQGALGPMLPERDTVVSPQHRMLLSNAQIREWFDADEVLVAAHLLICFEGVSRVTVDSVTYIHFMFEQHEIVLLDGAWSESYQPSDLRAVRWMHVTAMNF
ncbi:Hint domain-containing protein, partial [Planktotalea sp.]|uniref:Hint domain-containing protein n=1 Tax=Planktotalea sp. TaxID=2029877 RepID=UPI0025F600EE